jgi:hypothetical protein
MYTHPLVYIESPLSYLNIMPNLDLECPPVAHMLNCAHLIYVQEVKLNGRSCSHWEQALPFPLFPFPAMR